MKREERSWNKKAYCSSKDHKNVMFLERKDNSRTMPRIKLKVGKITCRNEF